MFQNVANILATTIGDIYREGDSKIIHVNQTIIQSKGNFNIDITKAITKNQFYTQNYLSNYSFSTHSSSLNMDILYNKMFNFILSNNIIIDYSNHSAEIIKG